MQHADLLLWLKLDHLASRAWRAVFSLRVGLHDDKTDFHIVHVMGYLHERNSFLRAEGTSKPIQSESFES